MCKNFAKQKNHRIFAKILVQNDPCLMYPSFYIVQIGSK